MNISPITGGAFLSSIATSIASTIAAARCEALAQRHDPASFHDRSFRVSWRGYSMPLLGVGLACLLLIDAQGTRLGGSMVVFAIAYALFLGAVYVAQSNARSIVSIKDGTVKYIEGGKERWKVDLEDILKVSITQWNLRIHARWRVDERILLPMSFAETSLLLAMLRTYRPKKASNEQG